MFFRCELPRFSHDKKNPDNIFEIFIKEKEKNLPAKFLFKIKNWTLVLADWQEQSTRWNFRRFFIVFG